MRRKTRDPAEMFAVGRGFSVARQARGGLSGTRAELVRRRFDAMERDGRQDRLARRPRCSRQGELRLLGPRAGRSDVRAVERRRIPAHGRPRPTPAGSPVGHDWRTASGGRNEAQPTSMISPNVHMPEAGADPHVQRRPPRPARAGAAGAARSGRRRRAPRGPRRGSARFSSQGCQASQVMSIDWYSRLANARHIASPFHHASPWSFEIAGEEVDHAHVDVDQPQGQVRARARRRPAAAARPPADGQPAVDRERLPARPDGQVQRQHGVDLVEAEHRRRHAVGERDRDQRTPGSTSPGSRARP